MVDINEFIKRMEDVRDNCIDCKIDIDKIVIHYDISERIVYCTFEKTEIKL